MSRHDVGTSQALSFFSSDSSSNLSSVPSLAEIDSSSRQETGIIQENRAVWVSQNDQWGFPHITNTEEVVPDVSARDRKREPGAVGFVKPLPSGEKFPALFTILATIPLAQERLLLEPLTFDDYGHNPQWWAGDEITRTQIQDMEDNSLSDPQAQRAFDFIAEVQRLTALLLASHRLYGNPNLLADSEFVKSYLNTVESATFPVINRFLRAWQDLVNDYRENTGLPRLGNIFMTTVVHRNNPEPEEVENEYWTIDLKLDRLAEDALTLYDCLDDLIWADDRDGVSNRDYWIKTPPPILTLQVEQMDSKSKELGMAVPLSWYADRYLRENVKATKQMRQKASSTIAEKNRLEEVLEKIATAQYPNGSQGDSVKLYQFVIDGLQKRLEGTDDDEDTRMLDAEAKDRTTRTINGLQKIVANIDRKREELNQRIEASKESLRDIRTILTDPDALIDSERPTTRYTLCGVATDAHTTYVTNPTSSHDQWTKIQYRTTPACEQEAVSPFDVVHAASHDSRSVLLVYALDSALEAKDIDLPDALKTFVTRDNEDFARELESDLERDVGQELSGMGGMGMGAEVGGQAPGNSPEGDGDSGLGMQLDTFEDGKRGEANLTPLGQ
jgi:hypothetical protein